MCAATVLVTGASGLLGRAVFKLLKNDPRYETVVGTAFSRYISLRLRYINYLNKVTELFFSDAETIW